MTALSALQDLFQRLRENATGQWRLGSDPQRNIFLERGRILFASSTHPLDRLTHLLVEKGRLTQDQMDYALSNLQPGMSVGKNLIQLGFITQRDLLDMAKHQVERVVWGAIGTTDGTPEFIAKELDNSVVRLNLDTPALLLGGLLNLKDRERLLDLLGPLTQVMVLDQVRLSGLELPPDLSRVPELINGRRTLLELSRDAGAEPVRLGAFVLFLREIGWGHLQDQPDPSTQDLLNLPLGGNDAVLADQVFLDLADPEPQQSPLLALIPPIDTLSEVPEPPPLLASPLGLPPLFESIQAASSPTHNLEHLSASLDKLQASPESWPALMAGFPDPEPEPEIQDEPQLVLPPILEQPAEIPYTVESGQAVLPTPRLELPLPPESPEPPEPPPVIVFGDGHPKPQKKKSAWGLVGILVLILGAGTGAGYWWMNRRPTVPLPPAELVVPSVDSKGGTNLPVTSGSASSAPTLTHPTPVSSAPSPHTVDQQPVVPTVAPPVAPPAVKKPEVAAPAGLPKEVSKGEDLAKAFAPGQAQRASLPKGSWALRLEIACQKETVQNATRLLVGAGLKSFDLPIKMKDGKTCTQIFCGPFTSREEAEALTKKLPPLFLADGNKPRPYLVSEIPDKQ